MKQKTAAIASPASNPNRRRFMRGLAVLALGAMVIPARDEPQTSASDHYRLCARHQHDLQADWRHYMELRLGLKVDIVHRDSSMRRPSQADSNFRTVRYPHLKAVFNSMAPFRASIWERGDAMPTRLRSVATLAGQSPILRWPG